jgi:hypothetical protein
MADSMDIITAGNIDEMSNLPTTISPPSLLLPSASSFNSSPTSAPIPPPPLPSSTSTSPSSVISRPPKRHVRPRATTEKEKETRLKERKAANRAAAKLSRERQKRAMEEALRENERLKEENSNLLQRLTNLEKRMQEIESSSSMTREGNTPTHQPARPMKNKPEPQCPIPSPVNSPMTHSHSNLAQTRILVYALQILMHSFVLSLNFPIPILSPSLSTTTSHFSHKHRSVQPLHMRIQHSSQWRNPCRPGYATPNLEDLSGAIRRSGFIQQRGRVKSNVRTTTRMASGDFLRRVIHRHDGGRQRGKANFIRLIIKKGKRMNK